MGEEINVRNEKNGVEKVNGTPLNGSKDIKHFISFIH